MFEASNRFLSADHSHWQLGTNNASGTRAELPMTAGVDPGLGKILHEWRSNMDGHCWWDRGQLRAECANQPREPCAIFHGRDISYTEPYVIYTNRQMSAPACLFSIYTEWRAHKAGCANEHANFIKIYGLDEMTYQLNFYRKHKSHSSFVIVWFCCSQLMYIIIPSLLENPGSATDSRSKIIFLSKSTNTLMQSVRHHKIFATYP